MGAEVEKLVLVTREEHTTPGQGDTQLHDTGLEVDKLCGEDCFKAWPSPPPGWLT